MPTHPVNTNSKLAQARIAKIISVARTQPVTTSNIAAEVFLSKQVTGTYIAHMIESGALVFSHRVNREKFYKATGVYHPELREITGEVPVRAAPYVKPFRCEWTSLFFGPATDSGQTQENRA